MGPLQQPLSTTLYANYKEEFVQFLTSLRYEKVGMICFCYARYGHAAASYWDSMIKPDVNEFKMLVATPLHPRGSGGDKKIFKGINLTTKNLLPEFDLEVTLGEKKEDEGFKPLRGSTALSKEPVGNRK